MCSINLSMGYVSEHDEDDIELILHEWQMQNFAPWGMKRILMAMPQRTSRVSPQLSFTNT